MSKSSPLANDIASRVASASSTAAALEELGYASAHTKASLKQILALLPRIDNKGLAVLLVTIAKTGDGSLGDVPSQSLADLASAMGLPPPTEAATGTPPATGTKPARTSSEAPHAPLLT